MEGKILSVCVSLEKGTKKREVNSVRLIPDWGIDGDAHSGIWHRQVSLLPVEDIDEMKKVIPDLKPGDFAENITTQGIDLDHIKIGDRIIVGEDIVLEVSQIGKECHSGCEIQKLTGECIMPTKGVFTKVLKGGIVKRDDSLRVQMLSGQKFIE
jgi:MOSC domain-containing protein YiiM